MKNISLLALFAILGTACTAGVPEECESVEGLSDMISADCNNNSGIAPTLASLGVATAMELKRWDPLTDFTRATVNGLYQLTLSSAGNARCSAMGSSCQNIKGLLGLQDPSTSQVINQNRFNPNSYNQELLNAFDRQMQRTASLQKNTPAQLAAPHKLTKVGGPTNLGIGACGPHWVFKPTTPTGGTYPNPLYLKNNLYFINQNTNPFVSFVVTSEANVGIDPIDGDNSTPTTTSGSCPTYELDRVYNPTNTLLNKCCVTVSAKNGALVALPRAAGYLGCKAGALPL